MSNDCRTKPHEVHVHHKSRMIFLHPFGYASEQACVCVCVCCVGCVGGGGGAKMVVVLLVCPQTNWRRVFLENTHPHAFPMSLRYFSGLFWDVFQLDPRGRQRAGRHQGGGPGGRAPQRRARGPLGFMDFIVFRAIWQRILWHFNCLVDTGPDLPLDPEKVKIPLRSGVNYSEAGSHLRAFSELLS